MKRREALEYLKNRLWKAQTVETLREWAQMDVRLFVDGKRIRVIYPYGSTHGKGYRIPQSLFAKEICMYLQEREEQRETELHTNL